MNNNKNSADLGGCYQPRPSASVDNILLDLQNSSNPTQPHSIIANYFTVITALTRPKAQAHAPKQESKVIPLLALALILLRLRCNK